MTVFLCRGVCAVHSCCVFINHSCVKSTSCVHIKYSYSPLPSFIPVCVVLHVCSVVTVGSQYHIFVCLCVFVCLSNPLCWCCGRINTCVGQANHRSFLITLVLFLLTSLYGISLVLQSVCPKQRLFTALLYCPGVYNQHR